MKILLLNDNPVVNKLVVLSAQKTSDEVEIASSSEDIPSQSYDLLIVDDSMYSDDLLNEINTKIKYKNSLLICTKDAQIPDAFSSILKKPFLPTDLVELFMMLEKEVESEEVVNKVKEEEQMGEEETIAEEDIATDEIGDLSDDLELDDELDLDLDTVLDEEISLNDEDFGESVLDDEEAQKVKDLLDENEEELSFDDEAEQDLESLELEELGAFNEESIEELAKEESEIEEKLSKSEEQDLSTDYDLALDLEDEADIDISEDEDFALEEEVEALEDEEPEALQPEIVEELEEVASETTIDESNVLEDELAVDFEEEANEESEELVVSEESDKRESTVLEQADARNDGDLEALQIETVEDEVDEVAFDELDSLEDELAVDLEKEHDEEFEELVAAEGVSDAESEELVAPQESNLEDEIQNAVESLTQEDLESELDEETLLQIAKNEIDPLAGLTSKDFKMALGEEMDEEEIEDVEEAITETSPVSEVEGGTQEQNSGVEALKKLLEALSDKDVAASMKGMKISINITLGDN